MGGLGVAFKNREVARLLPPESPDVVIGGNRDGGVVERWREEVPSWPA